MNSALAPVLTSPGWDILRSLGERTSPGTDLGLLGASLRRAGTPADVVSAVLTQLELRSAARAKFGPFADSMVFTRDGLEQATRLVVAAHHARRFREAGASFVADLGCGVGGDALAIAGLGLRVLAVDRDQDASAAAAINLRHFDGASVLRGDVAELDMEDLRDQGVDAVFADPARRTGAQGGSRRIADPEQWSPPLSAVWRWRSGFERVGVKLAPGIAHSALPADCHAQWVSVDGDLVEASVWTPALAPEGPGRSALVITGAGARVLADPATTSADAPVRQAPSGELGAVLAEPDPAVIRSGGLAHLADSIGARLIDPSIAYLTADDIAASPLLSRFEVVARTALRAKAVSAALRPLGVGSVEVKKRGADIDPAALRKRLDLTPGGPGATVFATRVGGRHCAIIARRLAD